MYIKHINMVLFWFRLQITFNLATNKIFLIADKVADAVRPDIFFPYAHLYTYIHI